MVTLKLPEPIGLSVTVCAVEKNIPAIDSELLTVTVYVGVPAGWNFGKLPCTQPLVAMLPVVDDGVVAPETAVRGVVPVVGAAGRDAETCGAAVYVKVIRHHLSRGRRNLSRADKARGA